MHIMAFEPRSLTGTRFAWKKSGKTRVFGGSVQGQIWKGHLNGNIRASDRNRPQPHHACRGHRLIL